MHSTSCYVSYVLLFLNISTQKEKKKEKKKKKKKKKNDSDDDDDDDDDDDFFSALGGSANKRHNSEDLLGLFGDSSSYSKTENSTVDDLQAQLRALQLENAKLQKN